MPRLSCDFTQVSVFSSTKVPRVVAPVTVWDHIIDEIIASGRMRELFPPSPRRRAIECHRCKGMGVTYVANATRPSSHPNHQ